VGYVDQGQVAIETKNGEVTVISEGDAYVLLPGHKTKVLGLVPVVLYEFDSVLDKVVVPKQSTQEESEFDGVLASSEEPVVSHMSFESSSASQSTSKDNYASFSTLEFESARIKKTVAKPGYSWKEHMRPGLEGHESGETSCINRHVGFLKSGQLRITMNDGQERTLVPGDSFVIEAGHQAVVPTGSDDVMVRQKHPPE